MPATLGSSARRRGREAARHRARDDDRDGDAGEAGQRALGLVDRVGDVGVREDGQEVAVLLVEERPDDLQDPQRARTRRRAAGRRGLEPAAGQQRQQEPHEEGLQSSWSTSPACATRGVELAISGANEKRKPVAVISRPLRLSGRRRQAISPHAANDPDQAEDDLQPSTCSSPGEEHGHERAELGGNGQGPQREPEAQATRLGAAKRADGRRWGALRGWGLRRRRSPRHPTAPSGSSGCSLVGQPAGLRSGLVAACRGDSNPSPGRPAGARMASTTATPATAARLVRSAVVLGEQADGRGPDQEAQVRDRRDDRDRRAAHGLVGAAAGDREEDRRADGRCRRRRRRCRPARGRRPAPGRRAASPRRPGLRRPAAGSARARARGAQWLPRRESAAAPAKRAGAQRAERRARRRGRSRGAPRPSSARRSRRRRPARTARRGSRAGAGSWRSDARARRAARPRRPERAGAPAAVGGHDDADEDEHELRAGAGRAQRAGREAARHHAGRERARGRG